MKIPCTKGLYIPAKPLHNHETAWVFRCQSELCKATSFCLTNEVPVRKQYMCTQASAAEFCLTNEVPVRKQWHVYTSFCCASAAEFCLTDEVPVRKQRHVYSSLCCWIQNDWWGVNQKYIKLQGVVWWIKHHSESNEISLVYFWLMRCQPESNETTNVCLTNEVSTRKQWNYKLLSYEWSIIQKAMKPQVSS